MKLSIITTILLLGVTTITAENSLFNETQPSLTTSDGIGTEGVESGNNTYYGSNAGGGATPLS